MVGFKRIRTAILTATGKMTATDDRNGVIRVWNGTSTKPLKYKVFRLEWT